MNIRQGSFRTVSATARVTIHKIKVVNDGDKGRNTGELYFRLWLGNDVYELLVLGPQGARLRRRLRRQGERLVARRLLVPRVGERRCEVRHEHARRGVRRRAEEELRPRGRAGRASMQYAIAGGRFDVSDILAHGALPSWYGTGVAAPAGHDGYFVFGTTDKYVKFFVLATLDIDVDWP